MNRIIERIAAALAVHIVSALRKELTNMQAQIDALIAQVAQNTSVVDSALTLIKWLHEQLASAPSGSQFMVDLAAKLKASDDALAAAVAANTPAAPVADEPAPTEPPAAA
jgi:capsule polysaccharide export protein KpsE/RkpR